MNAAQHLECEHVPTETDRPWHVFATMVVPAGGKWMNVQACNAKRVKPNLKANVLFCVWAITCAPTDNAVMPGKIFVYPHPVAKTLMLGAQLCASVSVYRLRNVAWMAVT